jgi:hypothetical protein
MSSEEVRKEIHFCAAALFLLVLLTTTPLVNMADAFSVLPGSTTTSHSKGTSARAPNIQMPVCHMASLPDVKRLVSKSGVPAPSFSVGIVLPALPTSHVAAATPSGELKAALLPSSLRKLPPLWASAL